MLFFFHIQREGHAILDEEGLDLPSVRDATHEARISARELAIEALKTGRPIDGDRIEVVDDDGKAVVTVPVRSVLA